MEQHRPEKLADQVRDGTCLLAVRSRLDQSPGWVSDTLGCDSSLHVIAQHQLLGIRMQVNLVVHPLGHRVPVKLVLEPVRSYVMGTISGSSPCR
jgi:hypothetical protein